MKKFQGESDRGLLVVAKVSDYEYYDNGFGDGYVNINFGTFDEIKDRQDFKDGRFIHIGNLRAGDIILDYDCEGEIRKGFEVAKRSLLYTRRGNTRSNVYVIEEEQCTENIQYK